MTKANGRLGFILTVFTLFLGALSGAAAPSDSDRLSSALEGATIIFKQDVTVPAGPRYQSSKILWNAGPHYVRAWVSPEMEAGLFLKAGTRATVIKVYADSHNLMGANVHAKTAEGEEFSVIFQYASVDNIGPYQPAEIPTVGDLKLAFDLDTLGDRIKNESNRLRP